MKLNPEYVKVASKMIDESPYLKLLGTTTELLDAGHYRCRMELDRKHTNMFGGINGGVNAGLLDSVTYWCLLCCMPEDVGYTTIDLTVNDMHSAHSGIIYAEGEVIKHGRTISLTEGRIPVSSFDEAMLLFTQENTDIRGIFRECAEYLGIGAMPPKFID